MSGPASGAFDLVGEILAGKYRIDRHLGRGGMGIVYAATQLELTRKVAVKVLTTSGGDLDALGREARAAAQLAHPHIVQVTDFVAQGEDPPFLVMELLEGESLDERLSKKKTLPPDAAVQIAIQVLSALEAAHAAGIVHRDVKPANIFLTRTAVTYDFVKLLDFGVARVGAGSSIASLNARGPIGTPAYMAPEQIAEGRADARTDVYAVGVCLYEMLAGEPPFLAANVPSLLQKICSADAAPLSQRGTGAEDALLAIIQKAMSKDPKARFASAEELRAALVPFAHAVAVPSRNIAGAPSEKATLRATSESSTTLEASPVEAEPTPSSDKLVDPPPPPPPSLASDATKTVKSSEPQRATLASSHGPRVTTAATPAPPRADRTGWAVVAAAAMIGAAWIMPPAKAIRDPRPAAPSASSVVVPPPPSTSPATCRLVQRLAPYPTPFIAHLSVGAGAGTVAIGGRDVQDHPFAAIARGDETRFYPKVVPGLTADDDVAIVSARDRVGFLAARTLAEPDRIGTESVVALRDQDDEFVKGTSPLGAASRLDYRVGWCDVVARDDLVLFGAGGPSREWMRVLRRQFGAHAVVTRRAPQSLFITNLDANPSRTWESGASDEPTLVRAFAGRNTRGVAFKGTGINVDVVDLAAGTTTRAILDDTQQAASMGAAAHDELATIAWMDANSEGPVHIAIVGAVAAVIRRDQVLVGQKVSTFALGSTRDALVFAWLTNREGEGTLLHAGVGKGIADAIAHAGTLAVTPAPAIALAVGNGESEPVVAVAEATDEHMGCALRVAAVTCE